MTSFGIRDQIGLEQSERFQRGAFLSSGGGSTGCMHLGVMVLIYKFLVPARG